MTPNPEPNVVTQIHDDGNHAAKKYSRITANSDDEEIVISGMSGNFPNSRNIAEYEYNLYNKIDMCDDKATRWKHFNAEIPKRCGKILDLEKFDAAFFGVHYKQAHMMDPQGRKLMENVYEAILDSGVNPKDIVGSNTGVYVGVCISESEKTWFYEKISVGGYGITGCTRAAMANRISYSFGLHGPSYIVDTACSSSMYALDNAFSALRSGEIDAAIIAGTNLTLHPYVTLQFARLGVLAKDGFCRPFDQDANGYTRSESVNCLYLQRKRDAKRIYATVVYSKTNCDGYKVEGITYPSGEMQEQLLREFYKDCMISPQKLGYLEAHSTGTIVGDPEECKAIDNILCKQRNTPLLVGSVKSNIGHSEAASGICSIVKVLLAFQSGLIAPNINFKTVKKEIPVLQEGRLKVVNNIEKLQSPYVAINSFGFGGANAHALLKACNKEKINYGIPIDDLPRLIVWAGRTQEAVFEIFNAISKKPLDAEFISLIHDTQKVTINGLVYRGYGLFKKGVKQSPAICVSKDVQYYAGIKKTYAWIFGDSNTYWSQMAIPLMSVPIFKESIMKSHTILQSNASEINLFNILTTVNSNNHTNSKLNQILSVMAMQIAFIDMLKTLGLEPDYLIGKSIIGELSCAYADNSLTTEQTLLIALCFGKLCVENEKNINGTMADIHLSVPELTSILPKSIDIIAENSQDSCIIFGPTNEVEVFVQKLKQNNVIVQNVQTSNSIICHSNRYMQNITSKLLKTLQNIIPKPIKRSSKWLSTSLHNSKWNNLDLQLCSAEYFINNCFNPILLQQTITVLPVNTVAIEMSPDCVFKNILMKSIVNCHHIALMEKNHKNNLELFLEGLGNIFMNGAIVNISEIYPKVTYPVSRGTPSIGTLIRWDHSEDWYVTRFENTKVDQSGERTFKVTLQEDDQEYMSGHTIDGKILVPATAYLQYVWETLALMRQGPAYMNTSVEFEDVKFLRATHITKETTILLTVMIHYVSGKFEITESGSLVVTGIIREIFNPILPKPMNESNENDDDENEKFNMLTNKDFYKELRLRGYHYKGAFRDVLEARGDGCKAKVKWNYNWVAFMDCLLQTYIIGTDTRTLVLPTRIRKLRINGKYHISLVEKMDPDNQIFDVYTSRKSQILISGGIELIGLHASPVQRRKAPGIPVLEKYQFISHLPTPQIEISDAARCCIQLILENLRILKLKIIEIDCDEKTIPIINHFLDAIEDLPLIAGEYFYLTKQTLTINGIQIEDTKLTEQNNCDLIIGKELCNNLELMKSMERSLNENGYIISRENLNFNIDNLITPIGYNIVMVLLTNDEILILMQKMKSKFTATSIILNITDTDSNYNWLEPLKIAIKKGPVILYCQNEKFNGLLGLVNCLRKEPDGHLVTCFIINDPTAPNFDIELPFYKNQLKFNMAINIYQNGKWGSYKHLQLKLNIQPKPVMNHVYGNLVHRGDLSTLGWFEGPSKTHDALVRIVYASLNFRDVMLATGRLAVEIYGSGRMDQECVLGFEFCGIDLKTNKRVMGMIEKGSCSTFLTTQPRLWWEIQPQWSFEEGATIPVVYTTVYYAFFIIIQIEYGKSVLIHAGTGGIGLAAIRVALAYGLNVFTTVSTPAKKQFLLETFPTLKECNIGNSRDTTFEQMIRIQTNGKGVDYVLNSLSEDKLLASVRCLAKGGQFLEIGKFDMASDNKLGLGEFMKDIAFHSVLADNLFTTDDEELLTKVSDVLNKDLKNGIIQPLPRHIFQADEIEQAFRFLASAKHMGKVILKISDPEQIASNPIRMTPRIYFKSNLVYVIPGGLGGFGLELADWLAVRGAKKLVLSSSRGITKTYQTYRIAIWKTYNVETVICTSDIKTRKGCEELLKTAMKLGPIGGIFNLAVVLRDGIFENQTNDKFIESMGPKAYATKYLDELSRVMCPQLEQFVIFSSVSCGRGNAGQTNYGMANSIMEKIIEDRILNGLPGKAIQWGAVGEVGLVADMAEDKIDLEIGGTLQQRISSCLQELDILMSTPDPLVSSMVVAEKRIGRAGNENIIETVMNIMGIRDLKSISMGSSLSEMGMDSLMAVEIKQTLERDFELFLTPQDLRSLTFQKLQEFSNARAKDPEAHDINLNQPTEALGLNLLLRNLGDESNAHKILLPIETKYTKNTKNSGSMMNPSIIVPGLEGVGGNAWYSLGLNLNFETNVLQLTHTSDMSTITEIADALASHVMNSLKDKNQPFYLIGYSFGALVTLEIVRILEKYQYHGSVVLIDGAPYFLKTLVTGHLGDEFKEIDLYNYLLTGVIAQIFPDESRDNLALMFGSLDTIEKKLDKFEEYHQNQSLYSSKYSLLILKSMVNRIRMVHSLDLNNYVPIESSITLVRPTEASIVEINEDYKLSDITNGKVVVHIVDGNHSTMLENPDLYGVLNSLHPLSTKNSHTETSTKPK